ncbi:MAG: RodZ domain-containing protein [Thermodesulfobacteriota bacterium]
MTLQEIGALLRQERERQNLELSEVVERTKISRSCIQAIENGDSEGLPHPVYARGFIKNYAVLLGLDGTQLAESFDRQYGLEDEGVVLDAQDPSAEEVISQPESDRHSALTVGLISLTFFILLGGAWLVYDIYFSSPSVPVSEPQDPLEQSAVEQPPEAAGEKGEAAPSEPDAGTPSTPETLSEDQDNELADNATEAGEEQDEERAQSSETQAAANASAANASAATPSIPVEEPVSSQEEQASRDTQAETEQEDEQAQESAASASSVEEEVLQISATEACWFRAEVDGSTRDVYLRRGESIALHFDDTLELRLGNAGGVTLLYNGEEVDVEATSGEVKTLRFP